VKIDGIMAPWHKLMLSLILFTDHFSGPRRVIWCGVSACCPDNDFELNDLWPRYFACWFIL